MEKKELLPKLKICGSMAIFGSLGIFVKHITLPSGFLVFLRALVGFLFLLPFVIAKRKDDSLFNIKKNLIPLIVSGACLGANWVLLFEAYRYTDVSIATLCYYLAPVFIVLASPVILKEKLTLQKCLGIFLALFGMVFISGIFGGTERANVIGIILGICAAVLYATVVFLNKKIKNVSVYDKTAFQFGVSLLVTLPYSLIAEDVTASMFSLKTVMLVLVVGIIHTGVSYVLYFSSLKDVKAHTAAILSYVDPILALVFAALILKETMSLLELIGAILVLGGAFLSEIKIKRRSEN